MQVDRLASAAGRAAADADGDRRRPGSGWRTTGFDPVYGARPLRRLVQSAVGDQLARALLAGEIRDGDEVTVDVDRDQRRADRAARRARRGAHAVRTRRVRNNSRGRVSLRESLSRGGPGLPLIEQLVVLVLMQAEVDPQPVAQPQQQLQLVAVFAAARRRRRRRWPSPVRRAGRPAR